LDKALPKNSSFLSSHSFLWGLFIFGVALIWMRLLTWGLPLPFGDDMQQIQTAVDVSWGELLSKWLTPFSPAWHIPSTDAYLTTRIFETVALKVLFSWGGYEASIYHWFKDGIAALLTTVLFLYVYRAGGRCLPAIGVSLLFIATPFVYHSVSWIADFEVVSQLCVLLAAICFLKIYLGSKSWSLFFLSIFFAWLSYKTRETAKILPLVEIGFLIVGSFRVQRMREKWRAGLIAAISLVLVIPSQLQVPTFTIHNQDEPISLWTKAAQNPHLEILFQSPWIGGVLIGLLILGVVILVRVLKSALQNLDAVKEEKDIHIAFLNFSFIWFLGVGICN